MLEIEVKIKIEDLKSIAEKIKALGAEVDKARHFEKNTLYDFASRELHAKNHALRLRMVNKKSFLTFKGAKQKSRKFKIREEYETEVKNGKQAKKILKSLSLQPVFEYSKYRTVFKKKKLKICLDETSIGTYLELEGEQNEIVKFAKALHLQKKDFITKDYIELIKETKDLK
ncbi:MAG: class IV adenylate cyclase [Candidatus Aminicenantes bacterium]|nr:class IV adenylate cyclase [Candidatus Aminicenantes bacterium]